MHPKKAATPAAMSDFPPERSAFSAAISRKPAIETVQIHVLTVLVVPLPRMTIGCWVGIFGSAISLGARAAGWSGPNTIARGENKRASDGAVIGDTGADQGERQGEMTATDYRLHRKRRFSISTN